jgi:DNA repair protein RecO (recombination protein O)
MEWRDEGVILSTRRHGETNAIAEILTAGRGRCLGLVRGGRSRQQRPVLQPGNIVAAHWRARLEDHLGIFVLEPMALNAGRILDDPFKLAGLSTLMALAQVLPEREPHPRIYEAMRLVLDAIQDDTVWPALLVRWEFGLLGEMGFGLDLSRCAATGTRDDLCYVSPKTGRAVSRVAGEAYRDRLLPLPPFLLGSQAGSPSCRDIAEGLRLTGHFLDRHIFEARGLAVPEQRQWIVARLETSAIDAAVPAD